MRDSYSWCTGEDSNLRSSQGAADLQSAAINHSATCAESQNAAVFQHDGRFFPEPDDHSFFPFVTTLLTLRQQIGAKMLRT